MRTRVWICYDNVDKKRKLAPEDDKMGIVIMGNSSQHVFRTPEGVAHILKRGSYLELSIEQFMKNCTTNGWRAQELNFCTARPHPRTSADEITNEVCALPWDRKFSHVFSTKEHTSSNQPRGVANR